jgi:hypothetical protein
MKRCFLILGLWLYGTAMSFGQDDLLAELSKAQKDIPIYTTATFKSTRLVSGHSIETIAAKHWISGFHIDLELSIQVLMNYLVSTSLPSG